MDDRWRGWANAEIYDRFVRDHHIYDWLNDGLVERAELASASRILDLGCGTGATVRACLGRMSTGAEVIGIDASAEMIAVAEARTYDARARFVVARAGETAQAIEGPFDRVLSNAAFWQFPSPRRVFADVAKLMLPGGLFVFNLPAERIEDESTAVHPFQEALARAISHQTGEPFLATSVAYDLDEALGHAGEAGLVLERIERLVYQARQGELMELMEIPALIAPLTVGLDVDQIRQVLDRARAVSDPEQRVPVAWMYVSMRRG